MRFVTRVLPVLAVAGLVVGLAYAADQTILGKQIQVKDPKPGVDALKRKLPYMAAAAVAAGVLLGVVRRLLR